MRPWFNLHIESPPQLQTLDSTVQFVDRKCIANWCSADTPDNKLDEDGSVSVPNEEWNLSESWCLWRGMIHEALHHPHHVYQNNFLPFKLSNWLGSIVSTCGLALIGANRVMGQNILNDESKVKLVWQICFITAANN